MSVKSDTLAGTPRKGMPLEALTACSRTIKGAWKSDVELGDRVVVETHNSTYVLRCLGDGRYMACGGWFSRRSDDPVEITVVGCGWGGCAVNTKLVAAPGLCLEFSNGVITSPIKRVVLERSNDAITN